ncbi:L-aspartate oxidase [Curtobacterium sp. MCBD17_003]|uniref:L-aspartate oxidase n=1 Tax=Curtobacterium sp. MCBD17_003 TaxID=2175667 RepID=UPI000DA78610|nr:L-aspartate oxidase [Curtobacterium sp. MCBD17_003]WIE53741.1 L-aspartate oxidase [Curtobacterium sp. MCBD17_003]
MHVVVVGSGIAGLTTAVRASGRHDVTLVTKGALTDAATTYAQGGIAVALGADDSVGAHVADTVAAGAGAGDQHAIEVLCADGPARVRDLLAIGIAFDRTRDPASQEVHGDDLTRGVEAAHGRRRILHADGDATGAAIERGLVRALLDRHVTILERTFLVDLVVHEGAVRGVDVLDLLGEPLRIAADAVVLATGGAGHLYRHTTNPLVATGDGVAAAWRAGAVLADLEFVQFHPTRLAVPGGGLVSEAVRGEGAVLRDQAGRRFMTAVHPDAELAPRDVVARGIAAAMRAQGGDPVMLDATALGATLPIRFPGLTRATRAAGFDWTREPVPVAPAAHYAMGGIATDVEGRASLPGLSAVGEAACTGVHGANRLASNSLLEGLVFGVRAADALDVPRPARPRLRGPHALAVTSVADPDRASRPGGPAPVDEARVRPALQAVMEDRVGLLRDADGLAGAARDLAALEVAAQTPSVGALEDRNLLTLARLVTHAAAARTESRGAHARTDHPGTDPAQARPLAWVSTTQGTVSRTVPATAPRQGVPA